VNPATVTAGTDSMIEILGYNTDFIDGETAVGFGSSDITVQRVWVVGPGHLLLNIAVNPAAQPQTTSISVASGLELATPTGGFQVSPAVSGQMSLLTPIVNQVTQLAGVPTGGYAVINTLGLPNNLSGWNLTVSNQPAPFTLGANGQLIALVPGSLTPGPAVVQLISPYGNTIPPVVLQVDPAPPTITSATNAFGVPIDSTHPVQAGNTVLLTVSGLADAYGNAPAAATVIVSMGGLNQTATTVTSFGVGGTCQVQVTVPFNLTPGPQAVTVRMSTRLSPAYTIFTN
jgi:uncharacterized protein (TIGR03437 family)